AQAQHKATSTLILGFVFGALFSALVWLYIGPLVTLLGATGETRDLAIHYLQIILPSLPFLLIGMVGGAILRSHGDARRSMNVLIVGGLVNAVLDPILIFGLDLELTGAALASVAARFTIAGAALWAIHRHHGGFGRPDFAGLAGDTRPVFAIAIPAILTQLATPVGQAYVTRAMAEYGEEAVAGMAIVGRLTPVAFAVIFALSGAVGPIIAQNAGARNTDRVTRAFRDALLFTGAVTLLVSAVLFALRGPLEWLFALQEAGTARTLVFLFAGPLSLLWFFNGVIFVANAGFNNLGHPFYSTMTNWGRHTLGTVPLVILFAGWFGAPGVLIGQAAGGVIFALISLVLARRVLGDAPEAPRHSFPLHARIVQVFTHRR
ncbi:MAG: MATE family efflux transporter, partial [Silicimonas sp.]|nr:MATE family efflux transporter [Silicimonas sp.]